ncbi:MAG: hypothetical protein HZB38_13695 [Planctomycetes bacterium]|nr:hypothetical protein [Planctomycetota bacterium]
MIAQFFHREVVVGEKVKLGVGLLLLAGCGVWLSFYYGTKPKPGEPVAHLQPLACAACGAAYAGEAGALPTKCQKCGKNEAYRALKCRNCNTLFPLVRAEGSFADKAGVKCTKCGKSSFTTEISSDELQKP